MKLKKSISLLLVLAIALMSFAFTVAAADTANLSLVADKDTTTLNAGDTFTLAVKLENIAAKEFRSAQVALYFDPEVLEVVDGKGAAVSGSVWAQIKGAFIENEAAMYNEDEGTGYAKRVKPEIDNEKGLLMYTLGKSDSAPKEVECIPCEDGTFTVVQINFKAKKTGATGLQVAVKDEAPNAYDTFPAGQKVTLESSELAEITLTGESIRIGVATITDVLAVEGEFSVDVDTALEDAVKGLPAKVQVKYDDDSVADAAVTWTCDDYNAEVPGEYTFTGTVEGTDKTASVKLTVKKVEIKAAAEAEAVNVPFGATEEQIAELLPATAVVTLENDKECEVPVTWTYTYEAGVTTGEVVLEGALDLGEKYLNTAEVKAAGKLNVSAKIDAETAGTVETVVEDAEVTYEAEATKEDVIAALPKTVDIKVGDATVTAFITWDSADYDAATAGDYEFVGTIAVPENVTLESDTITITVTVAEAVEKVVVEVTDTLEDQEVKGSKDKLTTLFPETVAVKYQDGTTGTEAIVWDEATKKLDATKKGEYTLNGMVGPVAVTAKVTVTSSVEVITPPTTTSTAYIYANGKVLNNNTLNIFTGQVVVLTAPGKSISSWSSTNISVSSVTADGKLVGRAPGEVTIKAVATDGSVGYFTVRVILNPSTIAGLDDTDKEDTEIVIPFTDLADYSWAARMICELANAGVVSGKTETLYAPGDNVTRAEYASLLVRAMKLSANGAGKEFTDVAANDWFYKSVQTASALGIVSGYEDGSFRPNASITREEMAVMTQRAAEAAGRTLPAQVAVSFTDADQISGFAKDAVNALAGAQIINGMGDGNFAPQATANRAQAAVIIYKLTEL